MYDLLTAKVKFPKIANKQTISSRIVNCQIEDDRKASGMLPKSLTTFTDSPKTKIKAATIQNDFQIKILNLK